MQPTKWLGNLVSGHGKHKLHQWRRGDLFRTPPRCPQTAWRSFNCNSVSRQKPRAAGSKHPLMCMAMVHGRSDLAELETAGPSLKGPHQAVGDLLYRCSDVLCASPSQHWASCLLCSILNQISIAFQLWGSINKCSLRTQPAIEILSPGCIAWTKSPSRITIKIINFKPASKAPEILKNNPKTINKILNYSEIHKIINMKNTHWK